MIEGMQNVSDIFSIFHDGILVHHQCDGDDLVLTIEILYLAERVSQTFTKFRVRLHRCEGVSFTTWQNDSKSDPTRLDDLDLIFRPDLDIFRASVKADTIEVVCNQDDADCDFCGGILAFNANRATVEDEAGKSYSLDELNALCKAYWDDSAPGCPA